MESKSKNEEELNGFKCKSKDKIEEIIEYWESLDLPKYKNKNFRNKGFEAAARNIQKALKGTLYEKTLWEQENRVFTMEEIKLSIENHHKSLQPNYMPHNKEFLKKTKLNTFFIPYMPKNTSKVFLPTFLQNLKYSPTMIIEPVSKDHALYLINRLKKMFSRDLKPAEILDCYTFINTLGSVKVKPFKPGLYDSIDFALEVGKTFYKQNFNTKNLTSVNFIKRYFPDYLRQIGKLEIIDIRRLK